MRATPIKSAARHPLQFWWFWTPVAVVIALSATFATYFVLGAMIAWNMTPPDRSLGAGLFVISAFSLFLTPALFFLIARRLLIITGSAPPRADAPDLDRIGAGRPSRNPTAPCG